MTHDPTTQPRTWTCTCGTTVEHWPGQGDVTCTRCGAWYNAFGQRLRDDWTENPSWKYGDVDDLTGFEIQHAGD